MKVDIKHETKVRGLLFKKEYPTTVFTVTFEDEEYAILDTKAHKKRIVYTYPYAPWVGGDDEGEVLVSWMLKDNGKEKRVYFEAISDRQEFEEYLMERLKGLKGYIEGNIGDSEEEETRSFEL